MSRTLITVPAVLPVATHVVTRRTGYVHHGIYVGDGRVVHYRGLSRALRAGPVEEVSIEEFAHGRPVGVCEEAAAAFDRDVVVAQVEQWLERPRRALATFARLIKHHQPAAGRGNAASVSA